MPFILQAFPGYNLPDTHYVTASDTRQRYQNVSGGTITLTGEDKSYLDTVPGLVSAEGATNTPGDVINRGDLAAPADLTGNATGNAYLDGGATVKNGDRFKITADGNLTVSDGTVAVTANDFILIHADRADAAITVADIEVNADQGSSVGGIATFRVVNDTDLAGITGMAEGDLAIVERPFGVYRREGTVWAGAGSVNEQWVSETWDGTTAHEIDLTQRLALRVNATNATANDVQINVAHQGSASEVTLAHLMLSNQDAVDRTFDFFPAFLTETGASVNSATLAAGDERTFVLMRAVGQGMVIIGDSGATAASTVTVVDNLTTNDGAQALSAAQGLNLQNQIDNLDPGRPIGTFDGSSFDDTTDLPAAEKNDYLRCVVAGDISLGGTTYSAKLGDRLRCEVDGTAVNTAANWVFISMGAVSGIDSVLSQAQATTAPRDINHGSFPLTLTQDPNTQTEFFNAEVKHHGGPVSGHGGAQRGTIIIESTVDFTTAEPALVAGAIYRNSVTGTGSTTTGQTFTVDRLYQVSKSATGWQELIPQDGWKIYDKATNQDATFDGTAWVVPSSGGLTTIRVDASAAAQNLTLAAATGSSDTVLYTLVDKTNAATLTVQAGEFLSDVQDAVFDFANYAVGTRFLVTDRAAGQWDIDVVGASAQTGLHYVSLTKKSQAGVNNAAPASGGTAYEVIDLGEFSGAGETYDPNGLVNTSNNRIEIKQDGTYKLTFSSGHTASTSINVSIRVNDVVVSDTSKGSSVGTPYESTASAIVDLVAGDFVEFGAAVNGSYIFSVPNATVEQLPTTEAVLAGMVKPEDRDVLLDYVTGSPISNGYAGTLDNGVTWGDVVAEYDEVLYCANKNGTWHSATVKTELIAENQNIGVQTSSGQRVDLQSINLADGNWTLGTPATAVQEIAIYGRKKQQTVVSPDTVPVEDLHWVNITTTALNQPVIATVASLLDIDDTDLVVSDPYSLIDTADNSVTVSQSGLYEVTLSANLGGTTTSAAMSILVDGAVVALTSTNSTEASGRRGGNTAQWIGNLNAGQKITFSNELNENWYDPNISVKQLTAKTINALPADSAVVEPLSTIQVSFTATTNNSGSTHYAFDETHFTAGTDLSLAGDGRVTGLKAGKTYKITANLQLLASSAGNGEFRIVDLTSGSTIGDTLELVSVGSGSAVSSITSQTAFFTPTVDSEVGIDFVAGSRGELSPRSTLTVEEVPGLAAVVVDPALAQVDPLRTLIVSGTGTSGNLGGGLFWNALAPDYEQIEFQYRESYTGGTGDAVVGSAVIDVAAFNSDPSTGDILVEVAGSDTHEMRFVIANVTNGAFTLSGQSSGGNQEWSIYGIKAQKTVINTTDTSVNDQPASGYRSIGNTLECWGNGTANGGTAVVTTFPTPFPDTSYAILVTPTSGGNGQNVTVTAKTPTSFSVTCVDVNGTPRSDNFSWFAIGPKP